MAATTTFINSLLEAGFKGTTYTGGVIKVKLFTVNLPSSGGVEVTGGSYVAQTLTFASASAKRIVSAQVTFSNLPTTEIKAYGIYSGVTLIDEKLIVPSFTADLSTNELKVTYDFSLNA